MDTGLPNHAKMAALPNDTARWGWLLTLCEAKEQRKPGTFASERHYRHVLARHGRFLPDYVRAGLMDKAEDGSLAVHDWQRHQWAAAKAAQRETPAGQPQDIPETSLGQKEDASRAVIVPVLVDSSSTSETARAEDVRDSLDRYHELTEYRPWGQWSGDALLGMERDYGVDHVVAALEAEIAAGTNRGDLLKKTAARLARDAEHAKRAKPSRPRIVKPPRDEAAIAAAKRELYEQGASA